MNTDVLVIGSGPAGIQAAIHAARKKAGVIVLGRREKSAIRDAWVENYCCNEKILNGGKMLKDGIKQAEKTGAAFIEEDVIEAVKKDGSFEVKLEGGGKIIAKTLIIAIGVMRNNANVKGEKEYHGRGVSYCVECDANFYKGLKVAVLGNGSAAAAGASLLAKYAKSVILITNGLNVAQALKTEAETAGVRIKGGEWIKEIKGDGKKVVSIVYDGGEEENFDGVFIELGAKGAVELAVGLGVSLDPENMKYIVADKKQATNVPGIFAAGDICGAPFQLAKAVGEGCVAGTYAADFVKHNY